MPGSSPYYETGERIPNAENLLILCNLYGLNVNELINKDIDENDKVVPENDRNSEILVSVSNKKAHVIMLYGQSNADGVSSCAYLEKNNKEKFDEYTTGYDNVLINYYNDGGKASSRFAFQRKILGCGWISEAFGPEAGIADEMSKAYPNDTTFIVKWAYGATTLREQWLDSHHGRGDLYNSAMDFTIKCIDYVVSKGYSLSIDGICWMQGESDSLNNDEQAYFRDTVAFAALLRHDLANIKKILNLLMQVLMKIRARGYIL